jgi:hypothetical protein
MQIQIPEPSDRHIATILAALRHFQDNIDEIIESQMPHFIDVDPLSSEEIDDLCMSINLDSV